MIQRLLRKFKSRLPQKEFINYTIQVFVYENINLKLPDGNIN